MKRKRIGKQGKESKVKGEIEVIREPKGGERSTPIVAFERGILKFWTRVVKPWMFSCSVWAMASTISSRDFHCLPDEILLIRPMSKGKAKKDQDERKKNVRADEEEEEEREEKKERKGKSQTRVEAFVGLSDDLEAGFDGAKDGKGGIGLLLEEPDGDPGEGERLA